jgi:hypothetical protein
MLANMQEIGHGRERRDSETALPHMITASGLDFGLASCSPTAISLAVASVQLVLCQLVDEGD